MLDARTFKLVTVGASAAASFFVLSYLFMLCGVAPFVSSVIAYAIAFVVAYLAQHRWTFDGEMRHRQVFPRYLTAQVFCALLSGAISQVTYMIGAPASIVSAFATMGGSAASFLLVRFWVFRNPNSRA